MWGLLQTLMKVVRYEVSGEVRYDHLGSLSGRCSVLI